MGLFKDVSDGYIKESTHVYVEPKRCRHTEVEIVAKDPCGLVAVEWCPDCGAVKQHAGNGVPTPMHKGRPYWRSPSK